MKQNNIYGQCYFYPLMSEFPMYKGLDSANPENLPVAEKMAEQVICLPIYPNLSTNNALMIVELIKTQK